MTESNSRKNKNHGRNRCKLTDEGLKVLRNHISNPPGTNSYDLEKVSKKTKLSAHILERMLGSKFHIVKTKTAVRYKYIEQLFVHYGIDIKQKIHWDFFDDTKLESDKVEEQEFELYIRKKVEDLRAQIKRRIEDYCGNVKLLTMSKPVPIDDIYIDLKIIGENNPNRITTSKFQKEAKKHNLRILITAEIGGGKTTFLKHLAFNCIQGKFLPEQLPLHVVLREYVEQKEYQDLLDFIANKYSLDKLELEEILKYEKNDKCLLLFDGLDQIEEIDREYLINQIKDFIQKYPINDYIISCRQFPQKGLLENFEELKLAKLDDFLQKKFIEKRLKALFYKNTLYNGSGKIKIKYTSQQDSTQSNNSHSADELINYLKENENLSDLGQNPLMLALICLEYINRDKDSFNLAETKWAIIREAAAIWLAKWNMEQGWKGQKVYDTFFVENLLSFIAYKTFKDSYIYLSKERIIKYIQEFMTDRQLISYGDKYQIDIHAEKIFQALVDIYGITLTTNTDFYCFPHIIFRNYFAILYIGRNYQSIDEFKQTLANPATTQGQISSNWEELFKDVDQAYSVLFGGKIKLDATRN